MGGDGGESTRADALGVRSSTSSSSQPASSARGEPTGGVGNGARGEKRGRARRNQRDRGVAGSGDTGADHGLRGDRGVRGLRGSNRSMVESLVVNASRSSSSGRRVSSSSETRIIAVVACSIIFSRPVIVQVLWLREAGRVRVKLFDGRPFFPRLGCLAERPGAAQLRDEQAGALAIRAARVPRIFAARVCRVFSLPRPRPV